MKKRSFLILFILSIIILLVILPKISATGVLDTVKSWSSDQYQKIENWSVKNLGFDQTIFRSALIYFSIGFFAGLILYIANLISRAIWYFLKKTGEINLFGRTGSQDTFEIFKEGRVRWFGMIASSPWKWIVLGVGYMTIMHIPIINLIVQKITLDFYIKGFWYRTFFLAFEIGFLPGIMELYFKFRKEAKLMKDVEKTRRGAMKQRVLGEN